MLATLVFRCDCAPSCHRLFAQCIQAGDFSMARLIKETVDALFGILKRLVFSERGCGKLGLTQ